MTMFVSAFFPLPNNNHSNNNRNNNAIRGRGGLVGIRLQDKVPPTIVSIVGKKKKKETLKILKLGSNKYVEAFIFEK